MSQGETEKEALDNIKEAIKLHVDSLAEDGLLIVKRTSKGIKESMVAVPL